MNYCLIFLISAWGYLSPGIINTTVFAESGFLRNKALQKLMLIAALFEGLYFALIKIFIEQTELSSFVTCATIFAAILIIGIGIWTIIDALRNKVHQPAASLKRAYFIICVHPQQFPFWLSWLSVLSKYTKEGIHVIPGALAAAVGCLMMLTLYSLAGKQVANLFTIYPKQIWMSIGSLYCLLGLLLLL